ncbi:N-6 Adenine-specific DNA methylases signature [Nakaseomyces glabratus]|nr:N-6 Adenine-specific DNA methylases signature [Nakaseomyces glabratus]
MRIRPCDMRAAWGRHRWLPLLLPQCRSVDQALVEFGWMQGLAPDNIVQGNAVQGNAVPGNTAARRLLRGCAARFRGVPLQYVLGSQPFGAAELVCRPGVLIPRWETEEWALKLARAIARYSSQQPLAQPLKLTLVDLCTGTGCVPIGIHDELARAPSLIKYTAVDVSPQAIDLCRLNVGRRAIEVKQVDVLRRDSPADIVGGPGRGLGLGRVPGRGRGPAIDILLCNPPYIPRKAFTRTTARSVRLYEPRLALIADKEFYKNLVDVWSQHTNSFVYEIGDSSQYEYVKEALDPSIWSVGLHIDSNGCPRAVYGYRNSIPSIAYIFEEFKQPRYV